jgi:hypothetical protein
MLDFLNNDTILDYGCVLYCDGSPYLFLVEENGLLDGVPLNIEDPLYSNLYDNEAVLVGVNIMDGNQMVDTYYVNDDNMEDLTYVITPIKLITLKTNGLSFDDVIDFNFFDELIINELEKLNDWFNLDIG